MDNWITIPEIFQNFVVAIALYYLWECWCCTEEQAEQKRPLLPDVMKYWSRCPIRNCLELITLVLQAEVKKEINTKIANMLNPGL